MELMVGSNQINHVNQSDLQYAVGEMLLGCTESFVSLASFLVGWEAVLRDDEYDCCWDCENLPSSSFPALFLFSLFANPKGESAGRNRTSTVSWCWWGLRQPSSVGQSIVATEPNPPHLLEEAVPAAREKRENNSKTKRYLYY